MSRLFILTICSFLFITNLQAERSFRILCFSVPAETPAEVELSVNGNATGSIDLTRNRFSKTYTLDHSGPLKLTLSDKVYDDPEQLKDFPSVVIKESWKKFILLAFPDPENKNLPIRLVPMELGNDFQNGDFRFINFLDNQFAIKVGSKKTQLGSKEIKTMGNFAEQNQDVRMQISVFKPEAKIKVRPLANQLIRYNKNMRVLFFMYQPKGSKRISYIAADIRDM